MDASEDPALGHASGQMANPVVQTEYFEIDSDHVGDRFGISVSLPGAYDTGADGAYPLLYATDGNTFGPIMDTVRFTLGGFDAIPPVRDFVQVNIGYPPSKSASQAVLRNRDLIPPGEDMPRFMGAHVRSRLGPSTPESTVQALLDAYRSARADNFLSFIEDELHPEICLRYRVDPTDVGLFGYSSGGLFTLYALTSGSRLFSCFGASSPGVHTDGSKIFDLYKRLLQRAERPGLDLRLHLTLNSEELLGSVRLYRNLAINTLRFLDMVYVQPLPGLAVTAEVIEGQTHYSGFVDAYRSFVRACYGALP